MSFKRYVELGRVCLINYGEEAGKLCTIVDVIDNNRVLVDGPDTGVKRQPINLKRIQLTDIKIPAKLNCSQKYAPNQLQALPLLLLLRHTHCPRCRTTRRCWCESRMDAAHRSRSGSAAAAPHGGTAARCTPPDNHGCAALDARWWLRP